MSDRALDPPADRVRVAPEVADALRSGGPVVALESTIISHGLPRPTNLEVAREIGLRASHDEPVGSCAPFTKAIKRLHDHRLVQQIDTDTLGVVMQVPPLSTRALAKLPESIQEAHHGFLA